MCEESVRILEYMRYRQRRALLLPCVRVWCECVCVDVDRGRRVAHETNRPCCLLFDGGSVWLMVGEDRATPMGIPPWASHELFYNPTRVHANI